MNKSDIPVLSIKIMFLIAVIFYALKLHRIERKASRAVEVMELRDENWHVNTQKYLYYDSVYTVRKKEYTSALRREWYQL